MISEKDIEEMEFSIFNKIYEPLLEDYTDKFIHTIKILNNDDLITYLAGQGKGRATCYRNEIEELISNIGSLEINARKELNMRLASLALFSEGVEKYLYDTISNYLSKNFDDYNIWPSQNASDISYIIPNYENSYGVILHVDAKSISGLKNLGDSLTRGLVGKFELNWNQTSYRPLLLRNRLSSRSDYYKKKHSTLRPIREINNYKYITITLFFQHISFINPNSISNDDFISSDLDGSSFDNIAYLCCVPNGRLQSEYYDGLFQKGKSGYDCGDSITGIPKDSRFVCFDKDGEPSKFKNLENSNSRTKLVYTPNGISEDFRHSFEAYIASGSTMNIREFSASSFN